jgi:lysophospholipase L1-like esterase
MIHKLQPAFTVCGIALQCLLLSAILPLKAADSIRVVCIGDSITQGRGDHSHNGFKWPVVDGWRYDFWKNCIDAGIPIKFVGTMTTGFESTPDYPDYKGQKFEDIHEARWGWTTEGEYNKLKEVQSQWTADVALIYLGTNTEPLSDAEKTSDPFAIARTTTAMRNIVLLLRQNNPKVAIFIREILGGDARAPGVNAGYIKLAQELSTPDSPIVAITPNPAWQWNPKLPNCDTVDGCHPNLQGDVKLASDFWNAAKPVLLARSGALASGH